VITTLRSVSTFESLRLTIDSGENGAETVGWTGEALIVLIGNGRRFTIDGSSQANMEDGLFDAAVIKDVSALDLMEETLAERLLSSSPADIVRSRTSSLTITVHNPEAIRFSLDGEIIQQRELSLDVRPRTLSVAVGDAYDPAPDRE